LRVVSWNPEAEIVTSLAAMKLGDTPSNEFYNAFLGVFPYIQIVMFLLPIYMQILRLQEEKQLGVQRHLHVLGLSYTA